MAIDNTYFRKQSEKAWAKYHKRNYSNISLIGYKRGNMVKVPIYEIEGVFDGWRNGDMSDEMMFGIESTMKIRISDLEATKSQNDVLLNSGDVTIIEDKVVEETDTATSIGTGLTPDDLYSLSINYSSSLDPVYNDVNRRIVVKDSVGNIYSSKTIRNVVDNSTYSTKIKLKSGESSIFIDFIVDGENDIVDPRGSVTIHSISLGTLNGSLSCPIFNIKQDIDYVKVGERNFKIVRQALSGSGMLMILTVCNKM